MQVLMIHKLADKSPAVVADRRERGVPDTASVPGFEPWPLAGVHVADPPAQTSISTHKVAQGVREGWIGLVDEQVVHRPGGPPEEPWRVTHTYRQAAQLIFHTVDGDLRYEVVRQPDKDPHTGEVEWFYTLERVDG